MDRPLPTLLVVGHAEHAEMQAVADCVAELVPTKQLFRAVTIADAENRPASGEVFPDVVIVCQLWPDEFTRNDIEWLFARFPLAAVLVCCGSWCDSDGRNRHLWPPAVRVPAAASAAVIRRVWEEAVAGRPPLPATASIEEVFARQHAGSIKNIAHGKHGCIGVASADPAIRSWMNDTLAAAGFPTAVDTPEKTAWRAAIWDAPVWGERAMSELRQFRDAHEGIPLLALIGGLRPHQAEEATACGADCVLPKIAPIDTILESLAALMDDADVARPDG